MTKSLLKTPLLAFGCVVLAHVPVVAQSSGPTKVGIIHIENAIIGTQEGQKAAAELQSRFEPRRKEIEKKQSDIAALREQMQRGSNAMSDEAKQKLSREIDQRTRMLNRETEDAQADYEQDKGKILQGLGQRMMVVIDKYAKDNGYALILDVSSPQTPVLYAANGVDITGDIIKLYDKNAPSAPAPATSGVPRAIAPTNRPAAPKPAAPRKP